jgi:hypothetical protein
MDRTKRLARSAGVAGVTLLLVGGAAMGANALRHTSAPSGAAPLMLDEASETPEATESAEPAETPESDGDNGGNDGGDGGGD